MSYPSGTPKNPLCVFVTYRMKTFKEMQTRKVAITLVESSPRSLVIWRVEVELLSIILGPRVAETLSIDVEGTGLSGP